MDLRLNMLQRRRGRADDLSRKLKIGAEKRKRGKKQDAYLTRQGHEKQKNPGEAAYSR